MVKCLPAILMSCLLTSTVTARSAVGSLYQNLDTAAPQTFDQADPSPEGPTIWSDFATMFRIYQQCASENLSVCLKIKLLMGLEKAFRHSKEVAIMDGIKFVNTDEGISIPPINASPLVDEKVIEANLPRTLEGKEDTLNNLIFKKLGKFLREHTLQVKFPDVQNIERSMDESRKKKDKKGGGAFIMIPLLLGGTFVPIAYGALAMLAGKALIVSKLALVLASIIGIKKLLNGGGHKESQHEVVVSSGGHSSGWGRDIDLAYNAYDPKHPKKQI